MDKEELPENVGEECQLVVFKLNEEEYGIDILNVKLIVSLLELTRVPFADNCIKGIVNLRGSVLPVIDLKQRLGLANLDYGPEASIITVVVDDLRVGLLVDSVFEVTTIDTGCIETGAAVQDDTNNYVSGVANLDGRLVSILNLEEVVNISVKGNNVIA